jgi:hypothetical protein
MTANTLQLAALADKAARTRAKRDAIVILRDEEAAGRAERERIGAILRGHREAAENRCDSFYPEIVPQEEAIDVPKSL